jgi:murein tripeptide amidase MpaA
MKVPQKLFDFLNVLQNGSALADQLLRNFSFCCIPMLNPDGADMYTRLTQMRLIKQGLTKLNSTGKQSAARNI